MSNRTKTVADYPPEFLQAWEQAAAGQLRITFPLRGSATNFRQRMYAFRKAFVRENGQLAIAHWFNNDLIVSEADGKFIVTTGTTDWKAQVRASAGGVRCVDVPPAIRKESCPLPHSHLERGQRCSCGFIAFPFSEDTAAPQEALESTLAHLGFGTAKAPGGKE